MMKTPNEQFIYKGSKQRKISFTLGGIGTGCIGLAGDGRLIDWEIFNRPNKNSLNGFSHFAVRAETTDRVLDTRVLHGDLQPPYIGSPLSSKKSNGFGSGPRRETLAGLPHFRKTTFIGKYPIAEVHFKDKRFPGKIVLTAFNPFIPLNDKDSGIPAAFFEFEITNTTKETIDYMIASTVGNPLPKQQIHRFRRRRGFSILHMTSNGLPDTDPQYGDLAVATDAGRVSYQRYWFKGTWFDSLEIYWRDINTPGSLVGRNYAAEKAGDGNQGTLAAHVAVKPSQTAQIRFVIAWNFPVCENYWQRDTAEKAEEAGISPYWRNYYATLWKDSSKSAVYALNHWDRLHDETRTFRDVLFRSSLPFEVIDAVSANISILKTPTVLRLEDGTFYGFEGCHSDCGCCEGTCTHVWNYAQALPFLFPALERTVREADYKYNQQPDGGMPFRLQLPLGIRHGGGRSCADGLFGNVMTVYRDWKISGDTNWLRSLWPCVKKSIDFAWDPSNKDRWDPEKTGVLWGRQHHTLDMELFGPSSWLCGFYLGALKAASEMAEYLQENETAKEYQRLFVQGKKWIEEHLFNGDYYYQKINICDRDILKSYDAISVYWDKEHGEIKYQIDEGCSIDQVLAQYHANLYGLGKIFDPKNVIKALKSIFRYNFIKSMRDTYNPCRLYALNDESGLVICSWPEGRRKPAVPLTYAQESMQGFEYAAAVQMVQNGMIKQGLAIVKGVRDRYDGEKRNPWNEIECGSNYARSMASYALLNAFSGFQFDMTRGMIGFCPVHTQNGHFRCFWSLDSAWGEFEFTNGLATLRILHGELVLRRITMGVPGQLVVRGITVQGRKVPYTQDDEEIVLENDVTLRRENTLRIRMLGNRSKLPLGQTKRSSERLPR